MHPRRWLHLALTCALAAALIMPGAAFARGGGGGGGRSFGGGGSFGGSSRSFGGGGGSSWGGGGTTSRPSTSSWGGGSSGWGSSHSAAPAPAIGGNSGGWGSSQRPATTSTAPSFSGRRPSPAASHSSNADRALAEKAKINGTSFSNRAQAVDSFKAKNAAQYPTRFSREPATRPSYVPSTYNVGGRNVTIIYHNGGYGYWDPFHPGVWLFYDLWMDQMMMNQLMAQQGYYYGRPNGYPPGYAYAPPIYARPFPWGWFIFWTLLGIIIIWHFARRMQQPY